MIEAWGFIDVNIDRILIVKIWGTEVSIGAIRLLLKIIFFSYLYMYNIYLRDI
mgnify:CR=1 FL=1